MESRKYKHSSSKRKHKIGKLHKAYDNYLLELINVTQEDWHRRKVMLRKSFEYSPELEYDEKKAEARYLYLFKEARHRKVKNDHSGR